MARRTSRRRARRQSRSRRAVASQTPLSRALKQICADLTALDIAYALVGGLAVSVRSEPRLTRDVDVAVATAGDPDAERCISELVARRYRLVTTVEQTT